MKNLHTSANDNIIRLAAILSKEIRKLTTYKCTYCYKGLFRLGLHHLRQTRDLSLVTVKNKGHKRSSHYYNDDGHSISSVANMNVTQITASCTNFTYSMKALEMTAECLSILENCVSASVHISTMLVTAAQTHSPSSSNSTVHFKDFQHRNVTMHFAECENISSDTSITENHFLQAEIQSFVVFLFLVILFGPKQIH